MQIAVVDRQVALAARLALAREAASRGVVLVLVGVRLVHFVAARLVTRSMLRLLVLSWHYRLRLVRRVRVEPMLINSSILSCSVNVLLVMAVLVVLLLHVDT